MFFFVLLGIFLIVAAVGVLLLLGGQTSGEKWGGAATLGGAIVIFFGAVFLMSGHTVQNGHIGIVKQFGAVSATTGDGAVFIAPWKSLSQVSVQNELRTYDMGQNNSAVSQDSQPVYLTVQVNYSLERDKAVQLYKETGGHFIERILDPNVYNLTKEITARYKAIDFAKNRAVIGTQIEQAIKKAVSPHGLNINSVNIKNVDFTPSLSQAIEQTVEAEQQAKREQAKVLIAEAQARQKVAESEGTAKSNVVEAQGEAKANRLRNQSLSPLIIQQQAIEKLNPNVQVIVCPPKTVCIPNGYTPVDTGK